MMTSRPVVPTASVRPPGAPPGCPVACADLLRERSRLQWRLADPGDPAALVTEFLAEHGLPVRNLAAPVPARTVDPRARTVDLRVCGAALHVSAGAAARLAGAQGRPGPAAAVPDVVAVVYEHGDPVVSSPGEGWSLGPWTPSWTTQAHAAAVRAVRAGIAAGDVYQVNIVGHESAPYHGDPLPALRRLAALPGARYAGLLVGSGPPVEATSAGPAWALACASPETLVEVRDGRAVTRPIKGTRPATGAGRTELLDSAKERAEHIMIVDLERNDLARVARTGSVRVDRLYALRRWCDLWQAESEVSAQLADGVDLAAILRALCPGGSVTGAPKLAALDVIGRLEPVGRGPSMGVLGWVSADTIDLGLTIRTAAADGERVHLWAGGGITWDSDPDAEVAEAAAKADPLRAALSPLTRGTERPTRR